MSPNDQTPTPTPYDARLADPHLLVGSRTKLLREREGYLRARADVAPQLAAADALARAGHAYLHSAFGDFQAIETLRLAIAAYEASKEGAK